MISLLLKTELNANINHFMQVAEMNGYKVTRPALHIKSMGRKGGYQDNHGIHLSLPHLQQHEEEMKWDTLGHEFAHWIQSQCKLWTYTRTGKRRIHDAKFRSLCQMLGVNDERTHQMQLAEEIGRICKTRRTMTATCGCQTFQITPAMHRKIQNGSGHFCRTCRGTLRV